MQFLGIFTSVIVIAVGFMERGASTGQSYFDWHAAFIILFGSFGAVFLGSGPVDFLRTLSYLKEFIPGLKKYERMNEMIEKSVKQSRVCGSKEEELRLFNFPKVQILPRLKQ